jgi:hypothetical protein
LHNVAATNLLEKGFWFQHNWAFDNRTIWEKSEMKPFAKVVSLLAIVALFLGFAYTPAQAAVKGDQCETFLVNVSHGINGTRLGLSNGLNPFSRSASPLGCTWRF